ncbi:hypothetical protein PENTCL1PPCAC_27572, partial [Pristionchus entomophagus]
LACSTSHQCREWAVNASLLFLLPNHAHSRQECPRIMKEDLREILRRRRATLTPTRAYAPTRSRVPPHRSSSLRAPSPTIRSSSTVTAPNRQSHHRTTSSSSRTSTVALPYLPVHHTPPRVSTSISLRRHRNDATSHLPRTPRTIVTISRRIVRGQRGDVCYSSSCRFLNKPARNSPLPSPFFSLNLFLLLFFSSLSSHFLKRLFDGLAVSSASPRRLPARPTSANGAVPRAPPGTTGTSGANGTSGTLGRAAGGTGTNGKQYRVRFADQIAAPANGPSSLGGQQQPLAAQPPSSFSSSLTSS